MAEAYDWGEVSGEVVERLRAPKIVPVPEAIIKQAQRSWDGVPNPKNKDEMLHTFRHDFSKDFGHVKDEAERLTLATAKAEAFCKLMRKAGDHTTPMTSVSVVVDPDHTPDTPEADKKPWVVAWKAGKRRGRQNTV